MSQIIEKLDGLGSLQKKPPRNSYEQLLTAIQKTITQGRITVEREKTRTYWQVGRHIHQYVLKYNDRAALGKRVMVSLARDLDVGKTWLYQSLEFYRAFPVFPTSGKLSWSHYKELLAVNDVLGRAEFELLTVRNKWSVQKLRAKIKKHKKKTAKKTKPLIPQKGIVGTRKIVEWSRSTKTKGSKRKKIEKRLAWDLGFTSYKYISKKPKGYKEPKPKNLYTFKGFVERVVDGDTLWCQIDLGFGICVREKLRLRGIDSPELKTAKGEKAKAFLKKLLPKGAAIVVRTSKSDKFDRYLADLYLGKTYLNQLLLDQGHAVVV